MRVGSALAEKEQAQLRTKPFSTDTPVAPDRVSLNSKSMQNNGL